METDPFKELELFFDSVIKCNEGVLLFEENYMITYEESCTVPPTFFERFFRDRLMKYIYNEDNNTIQQKIELCFEQIENIKDDIESITNNLNQHINSLQDISTPQEKVLEDLYSEKHILLFLEQLDIFLKDILDTKYSLSYNFSHLREGLTNKIVHNMNMDDFAGLLFVLHNTHDIKTNRFIFDERQKSQFSRLIANNFQRSEKVDFSPKNFRNLFSLKNIDFDNVEKLLIRAQKKCQDLKKEADEKSISGK